MAGRVERPRGGGARRGGGVWDKPQRAALVLEVRSDLARGGASAQTPGVRADRAGGDLFCRRRSGAAQRRGGRAGAPFRGAAGAAFRRGAASPRLTSSSGLMATFAVDAQDKLAGGRGAEVVDEATKIVGGALHRGQRRAVFGRGHQGAGQAGEGQVGGAERVASQVGTAIGQRLRDAGKKIVDATPGALRALRSDPITL